MSSISAGITTLTALVSTADTTGELQLQVNGTTPAVTLNTSGAIGVGSTPTYGASGQVLTSAGSASSPSWSTLTVSGSGGSTNTGNVTLTSASSGAQSITPTTWGQTVKLPDATTMTKAACVFNIRNAGSYPLKIQNYAGVTKGFLLQGETSIVGLADNSTAAGVWDISNVELLGTIGVYSYASSINLGDANLLDIDSDRDLFLYGNTDTYGIVFNRTTQSWGSPTLIRSGANKIQSLLIDTNKALIASVSGNSFEAVVLTLSDTTISIGTAATSTLTISPTTFNNKYEGDNSRSFVAVGSSYVISYSDSSNVAILAMTVSGTTVTIGTAQTTGGAGAPAQLYVVSSSVVLALSGHATSGWTYARPFTISGSSASSGTEAQLSSGGTIYFSAALGSRWMVLDLNSSNVPRGIIVSVSGTTATMSSADLGSSARSAMNACMVGSKMLVVWNDSANTSQYHFNVLSDSAGTATVGTVLDRVNNAAVTNLAVLPISSTKARFIFTVTSSRNCLYEVDTSGASATLSLVQVIAVSSTVTNNATAPTYVFSRSGGYRVPLTNSQTDAFPNLTGNYMGTLYAGVQMWGASNCKIVKAPDIGNSNTNFSLSSDASYFAAFFNANTTDVLISYGEMAQ